MNTNLCKIKICIHNNDKKNKQLFGKCNKSFIHIDDKFECLDFNDKYDFIT